MPITEGVRGQFEWSVAGLDKLAALESRLESLEAEMGTKLPASMRKTQTATDSLGRQMVGLGGERMAKYTTSTALLTGQMQRLGVQNEMVARGFGVFGDLLSGAAGPGGALLIAAGAVAALAGHFWELSKAQDKAKEATDRALDALMRQAAVNDPTGATARMLLATREAELLDERAAATESLARKSAILVAGGEEQRHAVTGQPLGFMPLEKNEAAKLRQEMVDLALAIDTADQKLRKLYGDAYGPAQGQGGATTESTRSGLESIAQMISFPGVPLNAVGNIPGAEPKLGSTNLDALVGTKDPFNRHTRAIADNSEAYQRWQETASFSIDAVLSKHSALSSGIISLQTTTSTVVQTMLMRENWHRMKGVEVAKYAAAMTASAMIGGIRDYAAAKVAQNIAQALEWASNPFTAALAPGAFAAAAKWSLAAGLAGGAAAALASGASKSFDRSMDRETGLAGLSPDRGTSGQSNAGTRIAASGASIGAINYYFNVTYAGATVYGDGGTRDWFYRELVPLLNEGLSTGAISRN